MGSLLSAVSLVGIGGGVLAVAWGGYRSGRLPFGSSGVRAFRPTREDNPFAFYVALVLYLCCGLALAVWGLLLLLDMAPPLKLR